jgi:hypothetical protein
MTDMGGQLAFLQARTRAVGLPPDMVARMQEAAGLSRAAAFTRRAAGQALGITGDRPFFLYWQSWALALGALGLGLLLGMIW